ncbi:MAG: hypothetical protein ACTSV5_04125 [Promethearchaeota archaeon]
MKKKSVMLGILCSFFILQGIFVVSIPAVKAEVSIPPNFYSELDTDALYVYNVTKFGGDLSWLGFDWVSKYNTTTNVGGQISVNFTGFHDKDPADIFNAFGSPMPYMDVEFIENQAGVLNSNHTFYNVSNGEVAFNLALGYNAFQSGFLIPNDNLTYLKDLALAQDSGYMPGEIDVEESFNFISFDFKQDSKFQNTTLVYEKKTGLLVWARTKMAPITDPIGYTLEFFLTNYSLDFNSAYTYNVSRFGEAAFWYDWDFNYVDTWTTNPGGLVIVNFTDYYYKDSSEPLWASDAFPSGLKRGWLDIEIYYDGYFGPIGPQISLTNISNREAAIQMGMGYGDLQSGFLIPMINNITFIREKALNAANPGEVLIIETELTISISYDQIGGFEQKTHFIYEKKSGLLQWIDTDVGSFSLEMVLIGFTPPKATNPPPSPNDSVPSFIPLILGIGILLTSVIVTKKVKRQIKKI